MRKASDLWRELKDNGILFHDLLTHLWSEPKFKNQQEELLALMEHFSFIVPVPVKPDHDPKYVVPALLVRDPSPQLPIDAPQLVLHFELAERSVSKGNLVLKAEALQRGFLPEGVVHHLFGIFHLEFMLFDVFVRAHTQCFYRDVNMFELQV